MTPNLASLAVKFAAMAQQFLKNPQRLSASQVAQSVVLCRYAAPSPLSQATTSPRNVASPASHSNSLSECRRTSPFRSQSCKTPSSSKSGNHAALQSPLRSNVHQLLFTQLTPTTELRMITLLLHQSQPVLHLGTV